MTMYHDELVHAKWKVMGFHMTQDTCVQLAVSNNTQPFSNITLALQSRTAILNLKDTKLFFQRGPW